MRPAGVPRHNPGQAARLTQRAHLPTRAANAAVQLPRRYGAIYWRTPQYNFLRFITTAVVAVFCGTIYFRIGQLDDPTSSSEIDVSKPARGSHAVTFPRRFKCIQGWFNHFNQRETAVCMDVGMSTGLASRYALD
eukprot:337038-Chlamydomonas_euryale.AAC.2